MLIQLLGDTPHLLQLFVKFAPPLQPLQLEQPSEVVDGVNQLCRAFSRNGTELLCPILRTLTLYLSDYVDGGLQTYREHLEAILAARSAAGCPLDALVACFECGLAAWRANSRELPGTKASHGRMWKEALAEEERYWKLERDHHEWEWDCWG